MERKITIFIKKRKVFIGKDNKFNTIEIDADELTNKEYKKSIIKQIDKIVDTKHYDYTEPKQRKVIEFVNCKPASSEYDRRLVDTVKRNEKARKEIERIRTLLK
jgi:hypothetical protein